MMKKYLLLALASLLLPMEMTAQGYHFVNHANGLEYICKDGDPEDDEHLFIFVGKYTYWTVDGSENGVRVLVKDQEGNELEVENKRYLPDPSLRGNWRNNTLDTDIVTNMLWYKKFPAGHKYYGKGLDEVTDMSNVSKYAFGKIADLRGVEYFPALEKLAIRGETSEYGATLDLSNNHAFNELKYRAPQNDPRIRKLVITNTQLTSLTFPTSTAPYGKQPSSYLADI